MVNYYYTCIYEVLQQATPDATTLPTLNRPKAKLVRLHSVRLLKLLVDGNDADRIEGGGNPTLYNVLQVQKSREERTIYGLRGTDGGLQTTPRGIAQTLTTHLKEKYDRIIVDNGIKYNLLKSISSTQRASYKVAMGTPFDQEEIQHTIRASRRRKAPGMDGLVREFYVRNWYLIRADMTVILNQMFWEGQITKNQKHGVIICLPKVPGGSTPQEYRPITLLNTDYKILARLIARRLRPVLEDHLTSTQYCGVSGNSILDAAATIPDTIAYAENKGIPMCVLSLDFRNAFDKIAQEYLFQVLQTYGIDDAFIQGIKQMYEGATSSVHINENSYGPIPIRSAIRQGCPMSMALYTLCLHPLLKCLGQKLTGIRIGRRA
jgi:hypothetical protein